MYSHCPTALSEEGITAWFHKEQSDRWSPRQTLRDFLDLALRDCEYRTLKLDVPVLVFRRLMCQALCILYKAKILGKSPFLKRRVPQRMPPGWLDEYEPLWKIYITQELPEWESLFTFIPVREWESDVPTWRQEIPALFQHYIVREERLLADTGFLFADEEGEEEFEGT